MGVLECNRCDETILDVHYHCSICDGDDYDLCEICAQAGARCDDEGHWMLKRIIHDGKVGLRGVNISYSRLFITCYC